MLLEKDVFAGLRVITGISMHQVRELFRETESRPVTCMVHEYKYMHVSCFLEINPTHRVVYVKDNHLWREPRGCPQGDPRVEGMLAETSGRDSVRERWRDTIPQRPTTDDVMKNIKPYLARHDEDRHGEIGVRSPNLPPSPEENDHRCRKKKKE